MTRIEVDKKPSKITTFFGLSVIQVEIQLLKVDNSVNEYFELTTIYLRLAKSPVDKVWKLSGKYLEYSSTPLTTKKVYAALQRS